jgi:hypothetical protein
MMKLLFRQLLLFFLVASLAFNLRTFPVMSASAPLPESVKVEVSHTALGKRMVFLNGKPTPLFWAYGLKDAKQLDHYKKAGFNTVYVDVRWVASDGVEEVIENVRQLADAAAERGLFVIYGIECVPTLMPTRARIAPDEEAYLRPLQKWMEFVIEELADTPNLIGWGTQHTPTTFIAHDDLGFRRWLLATYKNAEALNLSWGATGLNFNNVTMLSALQWDAQTRPSGLGEATMDVALYRWTTFVQLMQLWADVIHENDRRHLVVTGRLNDYKSIISVPDNYDIVVPAVYPTDAEQDLEAHNAHAVDMARQANQFIAVPSVMTRGVGQAVMTFASRRALWARQMAMHGASGVAFEDWNDFGDDEAARTDTARVLTELSHSALLTALPTPTVAMLYEPIAEGAVLGGKALHGFGPGISLDEPNHLFSTFRRGTKFGQVDYLSHDALLRVDLRRYTTIIAPLAFYVSSQAQARLRDFVAAGGTLVADLGIGMIQAGGDLRKLPEPLQALFGVQGIADFVNVSRNMSITAAHPLFPSVVVNDLTAGTLPNGMAFSPPMGLVVRYPEAVNIGYLHRATTGRALSVTLGVYKFGEGFAIYAPFRLWSHWSPGNSVYQQFHSDLFHRNALCALLDMPLLTPLTLQALGPIPPALPNCVEVGTTLEGAMAFNPLPRAQLAHFHTVGVRFFLLNGALTSYTRGNFLTPQASVPRLGNTEFSMLLDAPAPTVALINDFLPPGALRDYRFAPIQLVPLSRSATGQILEYSPNRVQLNVWTDVIHVTTDADHNIAVVGARDAQARLTLMTGGYVILPNSKHRVTITPIGSNRSERRIVTANEKGLLVIERRWKAHAVTIEPSDEGKEQGEQGE